MIVILRTVQKPAGMHLFFFCWKFQAWQHTPLGLYEMHCFSNSPSSRAVYSMQFKEAARAKGRVKGEAKGRKAVCKWVTHQECFDRLSAESWYRHPVTIFQDGSRWKKIDVLRVCTWKMPCRKCIILVRNFQIVQMIWKSFCLLANNDHTKEILRRKKNLLGGIMFPSIILCMVNNFFQWHF